MTRTGELRVRRLGRTSYADALPLQQDLVAAVRRGEQPDTLLLLEHDPVITVGRGGSRSNVLLSDARLASAGIELYEAGRGGDVTFHGPGQLVGYPVVALRGPRRDAHRYLRDLEEVLIRTAAAFDVTAGRSPGLTGVWVGEEKLAAIGVRLSTGWVTSHGFALNVEADLSGFDTIVPCGIRNRGVTSLARLTGREIPLEEVAARAASEFCDVFGYAPERSGLPVAAGLCCPGDPARPGTEG
jgi:lipoyl(octanoyl) transferase